MIFTVPGCHVALHCGYSWPGGNQWSRRTKMRESVRCHCANACGSHLWCSITLSGLHCLVFNIALLNSAQQQSGWLISTESSSLFCRYMGEDFHVCLIGEYLWSSFYVRQSQIGGGDTVWDANAASRLVGSSFCCPALHWAADVLEDKLNAH